MPPLPPWPKTLLDLLLSRGYRVPSRGFVGRFEGFVHPVSHAIVARSLTFGRTAWAVVPASPCDSRAALFDTPEQVVRHLTEGGG